MEAKMLNCSLNAIQQRAEEKFVKSKVFIMQIKLAQRQSRARLGKAQKFHSGKN